jgi:16S rRNA (uracil1498-N3)-methyltransferase
VTARFYCPGPLASGATVDLPAGAAHHAARVLRLGTGAPITLFNGNGGEFAAVLERADARVVRARVGEWRGVERESPLAVTLVQGLASVERMDYAVQKAVELGVAAIAPVETARSTARLVGTRAEKRREHWRQIAIGACEQCGRNRLPEIRMPCDFRDWLQSEPPSGVRLLLAADATRPLAALGAPRNSVEMLVGPEGGLTAEETNAALQAGLAAVHLGPRTLRTETAGLAAMAAMNALWGDGR